MSLRTYNGERTFIRVGRNHGLGRLRESATYPRCPYALNRHSVGFTGGSSEGQPVTMVSPSGLLLIRWLAVAEFRDGAA